jgi:hypothetical protein
MLYAALGLLAVIALAAALSAPRRRRVPERVLTPRPPRARRGDAPFAGEREREEQPAAGEAEG